MFIASHRLDVSQAPEERSVLRGRSDYVAPLELVIALAREAINIALLTELKQEINSALLQRNVYGCLQLFQARRNIRTQMHAQRAPPALS
jgi:hypothetical protein